MISAQLTGADMVGFFMCPSKTYQNTFVVSFLTDIPNSFMFGLFMSTLSNFCHEFIMALITGISVCTCIDRLVEISYFLSQCSRLGSLCSIRQYGKW